MTSRTTKAALFVALMTALTGAAVWMSAAASPLSVAARRSNRVKAEQLAFLPWNQNTGVGRIDGVESDSEGPKAFAVKPDDGTFVLDGVNSRVLDLDARGIIVGKLDLPSSTYDDIEQVDGWAVLVLDRLVGKNLLVMDRQGVYLADVDIEGHGIDHAGLVTAMLARENGVWLEVNHRYSVKVLDRNLQPCRRQIVLGRPAGDMHTIHGALNGRGGVRIWRDRRNARSSLAETTLVGRYPVYRIVWLDHDAQSMIYVVLHQVLFSGVKPFQVQRESYAVIVLDENLKEKSRFESPWVLTEYDQRVEFRVKPDGRILQMAFTPEGVLLLGWNWRRP